jgi:hypothetical protein
MLSFFLIVLGGCCCYVSGSFIKSGLSSRPDAPRYARHVFHGLGLLGMGLVGWAFWLLFH